MKTNYDIQVLFASKVAKQLFKDRKPDYFTVLKEVRRMSLNGISPERFAAMIVQTYPKTQ